ncbi:MAG: hypothetical protein K1060chlam1_00926 [Candidatus Anoxychlamydiales bacterium]|nr:hypothetical protein [Candidatus Anoxychlamydiales bacterium]
MAIPASRESSVSPSEIPKSRLEAGFKLQSAKCLNIVLKVLGFLALTLASVFLLKYTWPFHVTVKLANILLVSFSFFKTCIYFKEWTLEYPKAQLLKKALVDASKQS